LRAAAEEKNGVRDRSSALRPDDTEVGSGENGVRGKRCHGENGVRGKRCRYRF
jgi:hypothetical protein